MGGPRKTRKKVASPSRGAFEDAGAQLAQPQPDYDIAKSVNNTGGVYSGEVALVPADPVTANLPAVSEDVGVSYDYMFNGYTFRLRAQQKYRVKLQNVYHELKFCDLTIQQPGAVGTALSVPYRNLPALMRNCAFRLFRAGIKVCEWFPAYHNAPESNNTQPTPASDPGKNEALAIRPGAFVSPMVEFDEIEFFAGFSLNAAAPSAGTQEYYWASTVYIARHPATFVTR